MHPNPAFRNATQEKNIRFARNRSFGTLAINSDDGPLLSHVPFLLSNDATYLELHLVRSNPIVRHLSQPTNAVISVNGGDAYISPDWYEIDDQVPTWNYVAVHLRGTLERLPENELHGVLKRLSASMEQRLLPKKPWTSDKMDQETYHRMQRQIVPIVLQITQIDGTWKLSQNKPDEVRLKAADGVRDYPMGSQAKALSNLMRKP